ncbi:hypothetical protein PybrP1_011005 [[Pythium] brassicae (nom. inval.)]|nr:hypothetical protein PybrP1_011005 [[Pythium] brassicae (nom. inval.)]
MTKLRNRTVLLTYCSSPLGYSFAVQLAQKGASLVLWDTDARLAQRIASEITRLYGVVATAAQVDVRDKQQVDEAARRLSETGDAIRVSVVVHVSDSLGQQCGHAFASKTPEQIVELLEMHTLSSLWLAKALLPDIIDAKCGGHFVFMSSSTTFMGATSGVVDYAASKFALVGLARGLRFELDRLGGESGGRDGSKIQVTAILAPFEHSKLAVAAATGGALKPERGWLKPDMIAAKTILAIKRNKREVVLPAELGFLRALCVLLPQAWGDKLLEQLKYARASKSAAVRE